MGVSPGAVVSMLLLAPTVGGQGGEEWVQIRQDLRRSHLAIAALQRRDADLIKEVASIRNDIRMLKAIRGVPEPQPPRRFDRPVPRNAPVAATRHTPEPETPPPPAPAPLPPTRDRAIISTVPFANGHEESTCPEWLGLKCFDRYRGRPTVLCEGSGPTRSFLQCVNADDREQFLCTGGNLRAMPGTHRVLDVDRHVYNVSKGALRGFCSMTTQRPTPYEVHGNLRHLWLNSFVGGKDPDNACRSSDNIVEEPTLAIWRVDFFNPFHAHEDLIAAWKTYLFHDLNPQKMSVLFVDFLPDGPYRELYRRAFAPVHGIRRLDELSKQRKPTCFRKLYFNFPIKFGIQYGIANSPKNCFGSPILKGWRLYVLASLGLPPRKRRMPQVAIIHRRVNHPQRPSLKRQMVNRVSLNSRLQELCVEQKCEFRVVDFATMDIVRQVRRASEADVMVGTHGASLTFCLFMPAHGTLIEFTTGSDWHYLKMAQNSGIQYVKLRGTAHQSSSFSADIDATVEAVKDALPRARDGLASGTDRDTFPAAAYAA